MWQREGDDVLNIAREVEAQKRDGNKRRKGPNDDDVASREEVVVKGTGKAISKVMELGLWFQQRDMYEIRLETGSVGAVDDVSYEKEESLEKENGSMDVEPGGDVSKLPKAASRIVQHEERTLESGKTEVNETRIRQLSVLQVYVSLR
jgi:ribonuclease P/MRP protein subunit POP7